MDNRPRALYHRLENRCSTINELNRLYVALENRVTPKEAHQLMDALPGNVPVHHRWLSEVGRISREYRLKMGGYSTPPRLKTWSKNLHRHDWLTRYDELNRLAQKQLPEPFERRKISANLSFYSDGSSKRNKVLLIGFTGNSRRLMMPISSFLQNLSADNVDVALLMDCSRQAYRNGVPGLGNSLDELFDTLAEKLELGRYARGASIGTSAGGLAAVLAGLKLNLSAAMSVGGVGVSDPRWRQVNPRELISRYQHASSKAPNIHLVHGSDFNTDRDRADELAPLIDAQIWPISSPGEKVGHNALYPLLKNGDLAAFLDERLLRVYEA